ncbi:uncharacterized protein LOC134204488 [Armigeres subalbatus]|uniref:uncharacterized protein LOC134204488 n=1 Tax=Armigeres subalbatus TaxID=124917 RepID=UPI002ED2872A
MASKPNESGHRPNEKPGKTHHNGADEAPEPNAKPGGTETKLRKKERKLSKLESMAEKLKAERAEKANMAEQLKKLQAVVDSLKTTKEIIPSVVKDANEDASVDFEEIPIASSTQHQPKSIGTLDESRFLSSVNQLSISSIAIQECKPLAGDDEIHRHTFEMWKDLLNDCMALAGIEDEATKFTIFKVKAGPRLLTIFKNTRSDAEAPDVSTNPFSNALHRLKLYFGSSSDVMFQRRKLALMEQKADESDLAFITRVGETAQLCDFDKTKEFEEIVKTIAEHAKCKEVRVAALKMVSRNGTFTTLVDKVREIQAIRMNEEFFAFKHMQSGSARETAMLAPVTAEYQNPSSSSRRNYEQRSDNRYVPYNRNYPRYNQRFPQQTGWRANRVGATKRNFGDRNETKRLDRCWRCYSFFHLPSECNAANLVCRKCGQVGHIQRACYPATSTTTKRNVDQDIFETDAKQAKIEVVEEKEATSKTKEQVSDQTDS